MENNTTTTETSDSIKSTTVNTSVRGSARKPPIIRQTLASKLRLEQGNKLLYYKKQLEKETSVASSSNSKENDVTFKKPEAIKNKLTRHTPVCYKQTKKEPNSTTKQLNQIVTNANGTSSKRPVFNSATKTNSTFNFTTNTVPSQNVGSKLNNIALRTNKSDKLIVTNSKLASPNRFILNKTVESKYAKNILNKTNDIKNIKSTSKNEQTITKNVLNKTAFANNVIKTVQSPAKNVRSTKSVQSTANLIVNQAKSTGTKPKVRFSQNVNTAKKPISKRNLPFDSGFGAKPQPVKNPELTKRQSPLRKSLSAMHFKRITNTNRNSIIHRSSSWANISISEPKPKFMSPIKESCDSQIVFRTPSLAQRRSVKFCTPLSASLPSPYPSQSSSSQDLKRRLNTWLSKKGKPLGAYHHLRCFGLRKPEEHSDEENKENVQVEEKSESYEDLKIPEGSCSLVANDALFDLHKLILDGYPREQCEAWLQVIRGNFAEVEEQSQYWECMAALEESRGDLTSVLECYQKAIIKGAEIKEVDDSLESLFKKFQFLNISPNFNTKQEPSKAKMMLDARNAFKSKVINFAIQEHTRKKSDQVETEQEKYKFVVTPVRRSTRKSRSGYVSTPGVKLYKTLDELDSPTQKSLKFKTNKALA